MSLSENERPRDGEERQQAQEICSTNYGDNSLVMEVITLW